MSVNVESKLNEKYSHIFEEKNSLFLQTTFKENYKLPIHNWYKYLQAFSPNLVFHYIEKWNVSKKDCVLDPFAGVGTTPLACKQRGIPCIGYEISPIASFISNAKLFDGYNVGEIEKCRGDLLKREKKFTLNKNHYSIEGKIDLTKFLPDKSISYIFGLIDWLSDKNIEIKNFYLLALISCFEEMSYIRKHGSHYRFMNKTNVGIQQKINFDNIDPSLIFHKKINKMLSDKKKNIQNAYYLNSQDINNYVIDDSIFNISKRNDNCFTHIITSPPYLNRNNYIAQSKIESLIFKFLSSYSEYRDLTKKTLRSHVEATKQHKTNYSNKWIDMILKDISTQKLSYPKIPEMIQGYFEDIYVTLKLIKENSDKSCKYCFVVGNSRWSGIVVPVDTLLLTIVEDLGMNPEKIIITRYKGNSPQQMAKYGRYPLRESVVEFEE